MGIILHIGAPKTASTYLQTWLKSNTSPLKACGIAPLSSAAAHRFGVEALADASRINRSDVQGIKALDLEKAIAELSDAIDNNLVAVLSSEYFFESDPCRVEAMFSALGTPVTHVVCYLRRQDRLCASGYAENVRYLERCDLVGSVGYTPSLDWHLFYVAWSKAFPGAQIILRNFERIRTESAIEKDFAAIIGAGAAQLEPIDAIINPSLSAEFVEIIRAMNETNPRAVDSSFLDALQEGLNLSPFGFSQKVTTEFEDAYIDSNRQLAAALPGEFDSFAAPGWIAEGTDLVGRLNEGRLADVFGRCFDLIEKRIQEAKDIGELLAHTRHELDALSRRRDIELDSPRFLLRAAGRALLRRLRRFIHARAARNAISRPRL